MTTEPNISITHCGVKISFYYFTAPRHWLAKFQMPNDKEDRELFCFEDEHQFIKPEDMLSFFFQIIQRHIESILEPQVSLDQQ